MKKGVQIWTYFLSAWSQGQITFLESLNDEPQQAKKNQLPSTTSTVKNIGREYGHSSKNLG